MVFQETLEGFLGFLVLGSGFFLLLLLCLNFVSIEGLLFFTQFGQSTAQERKGKNNVVYKFKKLGREGKEKQKNQEKKENRKKRKMRKKSKENEGKKTKKKREKENLGKKERKKIWGKKKEKEKKERRKMRKKREGK